MTEKQKQMRLRIFITIGLFAAALVIDHLLLHGTAPTAVRLILYIAPYLLVGWDVLRKAWLNVSHGEAFDESFLMSLATIAAFAIGEFSEATTVMLFYQIGELFQGLAVGKARASISDLMDIAPEFANLETEDGMESVDPEDVPIGSVIVIKPGERVPLDGVVLSGESYIDTSALTGESVPVCVSKDSEIFSGSVNGESLLRVRTTKVYEDSTVAKILELVENASEKKARLEKFITRFAHIYTPLITLSALLLALVPPMVFTQPFSDWIQRACIFLIVACPCALVISIPLGFFGGIGAASRIGVLVKGGNYLEALAACDTMVFDKTGTLTKGQFQVARFFPADGVRTDELIIAAVYAEALSSHPIARSIRTMYTGPINTERLSEMSETAGFGISGKLDGEELLAGNKRLLKAHKIKFKPSNELGSVVYIAQAGRYLGCFVIADTAKDGAAESLQALKSLGVTKTVMLTGDRRELAEGTAAQLGIDTFYSELLPADKVEKLEEMLEDEDRRGMVAFIGDGINDAPTLMRADVGIAMGSLGSDAAIEAADIVLMDDDIRKLPMTLRIARRTMRVVHENVVFALFVKFMILTLGALGHATMWLAVFGDVGVTMLAILNAMRCLRPLNKL